MVKILSCATEVGSPAFPPHLQPASGKTEKLKSLKVTRLHERKDKKDKPHLGMGTERLDIKILLPSRFG